MFATARFPAPRRTRAICSPAVVVATDQAYLEVSGVVGEVVGVDAAILYGHEDPIAGRALAGAVDEQLARVRTPSADEVTYIATITLGRAI